MSRARFKIWIISVLLKYKFLCKLTLFVCLFVCLLFVEVIMGQHRWVSKMCRSVQITVQQQAQVQKVVGADSQVASGHGASTAPDISDVGEEDCETEASGKAPTPACTGKGSSKSKKRESWWGG